MRKVKFLLKRNGQKLRIGRDTVKLIKKRKPVSIDRFVSFTVIDQTGGFPYNFPGDYPGNT